MTNPPYKYKTCYSIFIAAVIFLILIGIIAGLLIDRAHFHIVRPTWQFTFNENPFVVSDDGMHAPVSSEDVDDPPPAKGKHRVITPPLAQTTSPRPSEKPPTPEIQ